MTARHDNTGWFCELLEPLGRITIRRMFGGAGLYVDGLVVALEIDGVLYLKTDERTRQTFADAGGMPLVYHGKGKPVTTSDRAPTRRCDGFARSDAAVGKTGLASEPAQRCEQEAGKTPGT
jgi:TfoX/Sxy family transcriptional regulator of competence genes